MCSSEVLCVTSKYNTPIPFWRYPQRMEMPLPAALPLFCCAQTICTHYQQRATQELDRSPPEQQLWIEQNIAPPIHCNEWQGRILEKREAKNMRFVPWLAENHPLPSRPGCGGLSACRGENRPLYAPDNVACSAPDNVACSASSLARFALDIVAICT